MSLEAKAQARLRGASSHMHRRRAMVVSATVGHRIGLVTSAELEDSRELLALAIGQRRIDVAQAATAANNGTRAAAGPSKDIADQLPPSRTRRL